MEEVLATKRLFCDECDQPSRLSVTAIKPRIMNPQRHASVYACGECGTVLNKTDAHELELWETIECSCGATFALNKDEADLTLMAQPASEKLIDTDYAKRASWFHATDVPNWQEAVSSAQIFVHVGTYEAAMERAAVSYSNSGECYLWEVTLKPEAVLTDDVVEDNNIWPTNVNECIKDHFGGDAQRYLNKYESPGSVSMLLDPSLLNVVEVTTMSPADYAAYDRANLIPAA